MNWAIIKDNEVINKVVWDGVTPWTYELPHDSIIQDDNLQIGMRWNEETQLWYFPEETLEELE